MRLTGTCAGCLASEVESHPAHSAQGLSPSQLPSSQIPVSYTHLDVYKRQAEDIYDTLKAKRKEVADASDDAWEHLKDGVESAWDKLSASIKESANKLKG